jgi:hypothetical protein
MEGLRTSELLDVMNRGSVQVDFLPPKISSDPGLMHTMVVERGSHVTEMQGLLTEG